MEIPDSFLKYCDKIDTLDFEVFDLHTLAEKLPEL